MLDSPRHSYHLVEPSPWPMSGAIGAGASTVGGVLYMHPSRGCSTVGMMGLVVILYTLFLWWRDVLREAKAGQHTPVVQNGPIYGSLLFLVSEVMFLLSLFWASYHSALAPAVEVGLIWPPQGILHFDPRELPMLNTLIPPTSGASITWAHHDLLNGRYHRSVFALLATVALALVFTGLQGLEYEHSYFSLSDSIYGSTFSLATGCHGLHVIIGTLYSSICCYRQSIGQFGRAHHVGFETAAWYWHFVDVVRVILFVSVYWWGGRG
uniref:Cytochrome c oxidase subunit 3 n=2 Tax=Viscum TaxID=3971 RepID=A0AB39A6M3_9MAGN|nr:cytochrome c oxidase subunit 3 [Viscum scurruloideum]